MVTRSREGLSRRELLRRGALAGGVLAWAAPTVQTLGMRPALAAATSYGISYVGFVLQCGGDTFLVKWEVEGESGAWDAGGSLPCDGSSKVSPPYEITASGFPAGLPSPTQTPAGDDKVKWTFNFTNGCTVMWAVNKCGSTCIVTDYGSDSGVTKVTFSPCPAT